MKHPLQVEKSLPPSLPGTIRKNMTPEMPIERYRRLALGSLKKKKYAAAVEHWKAAQVAKNLCAKLVPRTVCCVQCLKNWLLHEALKDDKSRDEFLFLAENLDNWFTHEIQGESL